MKNTLIWLDNEKYISNLSLDKKGYLFDVIVSDTKSTEFKKIVNAMKKSGANRIMKIYNDYKFEMIYKNNSVWSSIKFENCITNWMLFKNKTPKKSDNIVMPNVFNGSETEIELPYFINEDNLDIYKEVFQFYLEDDSIKKVVNISEKTYSTILNEFIIDDRNKFENFKKLISKSEPKGLVYNSYNLIDDNNIELETKFGKINIKIDDKFKVLISGVLYSDYKDIAELFSFTKGIGTNIESYIKVREVYNNEPKKISRKTKLLSLLSVIFVVILVWVTFGIIFGHDNTSQAIKILTSSYTWSHQWIYLMWINFFISLFLIPIVAVIFIKAIEPKQKINFKRHANIFISAQVRSVAVFLTGNPMLATIIWGWYINSTRGIKVVGVVGMVLSINIIRGIVILPIGIIFMISGTIFNHSVYQEMGMMNQYYLFVTLSWIGWIWHTAEHLALNILIVLPPLHILFNKGMYLWYRNEKKSEVLINKFTTFEMNLIHLRHSFKEIFKNRQRLLRMSITMFIVIIIETFEFTFGLRMVEDYAIHYGVFNDLTSSANYWNVFEISGVRYMSSFIRHLPLISIMPGQGVGFTELTLSSYAIGVIQNGHGFALSDSTVSALSSQTTFVMRFFNFYLKKIIAMIICMIFIPMAIMRRNQKYKEMQKYK